MCLDELGQTFVIRLVISPDELSSVVRVVQVAQQKIVRLNG